MAKHKFLLDPNLTASENLGLAVQYAAPVILARYRLGNIDWSTRNEIYAEIRAAAYTHFILHKVRRHKYCRVSKSGKQLDFFDNVLSSTWSVTSSILDKYLNLFTKKHNIISMEKAEYENRHLWDILPDTGSLLDNSAYKNPFNPIDRMRVQAERPWYHLEQLLEEYSDYVEDSTMMGISPMTEEEWLSRNATQEELLVYGRRKTVVVSKSESPREYMRRYQAERRKMQRMAEYKLFESDPSYQGRPGRFK